MTITPDRAAGFYPHAFWVRRAAARSSRPRCNPIRRPVHLQGGMQRPWQSGVALYRQNCFELTVGLLLARRLLPSLASCRVAKHPSIS